MSTHRPWHANDREAVVRRSSGPPFNRTCIQFDIISPCAHFRLPVHLLCCTSPTVLAVHYGLDTGLVSTKGRARTYPPARSRSWRGWTGNPYVLLCLADPSWRICPAPVLSYEHITLLDWYSLPAFSSTHVYYPARIHIHLSIVRCAFVPAPSFPGAGTTSRLKRAIYSKLCTCLYAQMR